MIISQPENKLIFLTHRASRGLTPAEQVRSVPSAAPAGTACAARARGWGVPSTGDSIGPRACSAAHKRTACKGTLSFSASCGKCGKLEASDFGKRGARPGKQNSPVHVTRRARGYWDELLRKGLFKGGAGEFGGKTPKHSQREGPCLNRTPMAPGPVPFL